MAGGFGRDVEGPPSGGFLLLGHPQHQLVHRHHPRLRGGHLAGHQSDKISHIDTVIFRMDTVISCIDTVTFRVIFHIDTVMFHIDTVMLRSASKLIPSSCHLVDRMTISYLVTLPSLTDCV